MKAVQNSFRFYCVDACIAAVHAVLGIQGSKFIFGFGSTCATRCIFLGALPTF